MESIGNLTVETDHFYQITKGNELKREALIDSFDKMYVPLIIEDKEVYHWLIRRVTCEYLLNYFYQWLEVSVEGSTQLSVPDWRQVSIMLEKSLPKIIFKHDINVKHKQEIQVIIKKEDREKNINEKCVNNSRNKRKELRNMKSFTPQRVSRDEMF
ncbi:hypothetical protein FE783_35050 [Paenibacillus mesophilus]|uniref:hypothetical protein n=1 Tax=Paenibacillus mesophilus TaxID=2582849 RepID=UPI00110F1C78|nr:hypothetical protein [Paenibacillus mesophilus]TMV43514.1 hypothetical protein FE783_35050 [Paenibacillus mesophilus]